MAEWENRLGQDSPLARALRLAMPEDMRNPLLHPESVNHFALPPKQPTAELRNPAPRPGEYLSPVSEALSPTMGAYGLGNALGDAYVKGREGDYKGMASPLAEILLSMAPVPGMKKGAMPPRVENPIKAYHGSPYDFDRFDPAKIGTGEGAQAYGHGLYFAENEGVARSYRDGLSLQMDNASRPERLAAEWYLSMEKDAKKAAQIARTQARETKYDHTLAADWIKAAELLESKNYRPPGKMYEVAIHATPDQFLDWDKPLSQQSEAVRKFINENVKGASGMVDRKVSGDPTGKQVWESLRNPFVAKKAGYEDWAGGGPSAKLNEAGIPGIRYLDAGSRGAGPRRWPCPPHGSADSSG